MPILWDDKYSTGEAKIDAQHQKLFTFINDIETLSKQETADRNEVERLIRFMVSYAGIHFTYEEFCMVRYKCPTYDKNLEAHDKFNKLAETYKARFQAEGPSKQLLQDIYTTCSSWLSNHILKIDTHLKSCVHS